MDFSTIADWSSIVGTIVGLLGFVITIRQVRVLSAKVKATSDEIRNQMLKLYSMVQATDVVRQIEILYKDLDHQNWGCALMRIREVHKALVEISFESKIKDIVGNSLSNSMQRMPSDIELIHDLSIGLEENADIRFVLRNLQSIQDDLKRIETKYKQTI